MEQIHPQLRDFIIDYCRKYKVQRVNLDDLSPNTSIDLDLDIFDIEIDLFIDEFAEHFKIDASRFTWYKYGYPTGSNKVNMLKMLFGYKRPWVKQLAERWYTPKLRVHTLQSALKTGKLV
ncbi:DUF1493 family protein [Mucilaginibacter psychrotolerans]|uniref:DUF1493 family protein n=1 Tax=Mucilaginibacter psychrotolerans TaxID=1524096 RepID=A0A4Y8S9W5_9SPHI|nr:DUF1493 family protein [Mucilaginibacter psychrotolerans]TFF35347.1 DUF1493 family protein [Mucilaginibacter psychrotolerans]